MKLFNTRVVVVSTILLIGLAIAMIIRVEKLEGQKPEVVLYVENSEAPRSFIVYDMAKKLTSDDAKLEKILELANDKKKKNELLTLLNSL